MAAFAVVTCS